MAPRKKAARSRPRRPVDDPVTAYARAVVAKTIVAGMMVRLACRRHLKDLEEQEARGLVWQPDQAQVAIDFFEGVLYLPDEIDEDILEATLAEDTFEAIELAGKPFLLSPFQKFIVGSLCGWFKTDGHTRFRICHFETAKGSGKTPLAAGMLVLRLVIKAGIRKQMYVAATQEGQARLTFTDAVNMVLASPALRERLDVSANSISNLKTGSFIKPVSAEKRGLDGKRVDGAVSDEVQEHPSGVVVEKMRAGVKNRKSALLMLTMNSGYDRTSIGWELHEYSRQVLEGTIDNDQWFAYVCQLDPCDACYARGHRAPDEKCSACDQWHTEGPHWLKVNPNLGVSLPWEYLREQVKEALGMPTKQAIVMRLNFCIWTEQYQIWIPRDQWDLCQVEKAQLSASNPNRLACVASLDLSIKYDLSTCMIGIRHDDPDGAHAETVEISGTDADTGEAYTRSLNLDFTIELLPFFWMPEDTLQVRVQKDRIPFDVWKKQGGLETTKGPVVDYGVIYDKLVKDLVKPFAIQQIGYDQYNATHIGAKLRDEARLTTVELKQGKFLSEAAKTLHALVRAKRIRHGGNPVMGWCVSNAQAKEDRFENIWLEKPSKIQRIDGVTAACGVIFMLINLPRKRKSVFKKRGALVWTPSGFKSITDTTQPPAR
jgi:phage terminase large subunit-like protein